MKEPLKAKLAESEDEKMIKFIKKQLFNIKKKITTNYKLDVQLNKAIDWLEKQGEKDILEDAIIDSNEDGLIADTIKQWKQKPMVVPKFGIGDTIKNKITNKVFTISDRCLHLEYYHDKNHLFEVMFSEQDDWELVEQKSTDKVEPKFKVGDWIVSDNNNSITKIKKVTNT